MTPLTPLNIYHIAQFGDGVAMSMIRTLNLLYLVLVVGLDPLQLVLVGTVLELSYFLFEIPTGVVADRYSRKWSVVIGFGLIGVGFILEGTVPQYFWVLVSQVLFGVGATFTSGAYEAWVGAEVTLDDQSSLSQVFLRGSQTHQAAAFIGIVVAVVVGGENVATPIVIGGALTVLLAVFLAAAMPETNFNAVGTGDRYTFSQFGSDLANGFHTIRESRALIVAALFFLVWGGASEGFDRLWTPSLLERFEFPPLMGLSVGVVGWFGLIRAGGLVLSIAGAEVAHRRLAEDDQRAMAQWMLSIVLVLSASIALLAWSPRLIWAVSAIWLVSAARNVADTLVISWTSLNSPIEKRATILSAVRQSDSIGQIAVGPGIGWIARTRSIGVALGISATLVAGTLPLWAKERLRHEKAVR